MQTNDSHLDWNDIAKYVLGDGDMDESARAAFGQRIHADSALQTAVTDVRRGLAAIQPSVPTSGLEAARRRLALGMASIDGLDAAAAQATNVPRNASRVRPGFTRGMGPRGWGYTVGAAACAVVLAIPLWRHLTPANAGRLGADMISTKTFSTGIGQRANLQLPDGSNVQLAPGSRLDYARDFGRNSRRLRLRGEAVFTVVRSSGHPFIVDAGATDVRVLGTTFGVRAYGTDDAVNVMVAEGKVALRGGTVLTIGEISSTARDGTTRVSRGDIMAYLSWTQGRLVYDRAPLAQLARDLERWYGLTVRIADPTLAQRLVTTELTERPVDEVLRTLATALDARYTRVGTLATFSPR